MELKDKIKNYWIKLYPELDKPEEIDGLLKNSFGEGMDDFLKRAEKKHFFNREETINMIEDIFNLQNHEELLGFEERCKGAVKYYNFFRPIVNYCYWRFYDQVKAIASQISFDDIVMNTLEEISHYAIKLLVLDVNYMKNADKLDGDTSKERHSYYEEVILANPKLLKEMYVNYYEYVRLALNMTDLCTQYCIEILKNFNKDKAALQEKLEIAKTEDIDIASIKIGSGDRHNGKSVAQVLLTNKMQVLYKPHSLDLDRDFSNLINWINKNKTSEMLDMRAAECLSYDNYSWAFFVDHNQVNSEEEINRYYHRAGQLLGLMYMLNGVDCHNENIIADGEYPILIDTETLLHPNIKGRENANSRATDSIEKYFGDYISKSVISTGLLPYFVIGNEDDSERVDVSGLSCVGKSKYPFKSVEFVNFDSDEVKLERSYQDMPERKNCPVYKDNIYDGINYKEDIKNGFNAMYDWILENRDLVLKYLRENFKETTVRVLMRATHIYGRLLETSVHPDFLGDDISRRVLLSRIGINSTKEYKNIIPYECESMLENDVPYFTCQLGSDKLICNGHSIDGMLAEAPIDAVSKKILAFSDNDKRQQLHYIDVAYKLKESAHEKDVSSLKFSKDAVNKNNYGESDYINFAKKVADYLVDYSVETEIDGKTIRGWLTSSLKGNSSKLSEIIFPSYNIYAGIAGIGLFLLEIARVTGEEKYKKAARDCVRAIQYKVNVLRASDIVTLGSYNGVSGYALLLYDAYKFFKEPALQADLNLILDKISANIDHTMFNDVIQGNAGAIQVLNYIYRDNDEYKEETLAIIEKIVNKMYRELYRNDNESLTWVGAEDIQRYSGYAHGTAGIIAQLARVRDLLDTEKVDEMIAAALVFERTFYNDEIKNWYTTTDMDEIGNGWCHGSPGFLLEKCILRESGYKDDLIEKEYEVALRNTIELSIGCTHCYCHGDVGNIEIIYEAAARDNDIELMDRCLATYNVSLKEHLSKKYNGEAFRGGDVVGLMLGSTGFGYSALRYSNPEKVKSILLF